MNQMKKLFVCILFFVVLGCELGEVSSSSGDAAPAADAAMPAEDGGHVEPCDSAIPPVLAPMVTYTGTFGAGWDRLEGRQPETQCRYDNASGALWLRLRDYDGVRELEISTNVLGGGMAGGTVAVVLSGTSPRRAFFVNGDCIGSTTSPGLGSIDGNLVCRDRLTRAVVLDGRFSAVNCMP